MAVERQLGLWEAVQNVMYVSQRSHGLMASTVPIQSLLHACLSVFFSFPFFFLFSFSGGGAEMIPVAELIESRLPIWKVGSFGSKLN